MTLGLHRDEDHLFSKRSNRQLGCDLADLIGLDQSFKNQSSGTSQLYWNRKARQKLSAYIASVTACNPDNPPNPLVGEGLFEKRGFLLRHQLVDLMCELTEALIQDSAKASEMDCEGEEDEGPMLNPFNLHLMHKDSTGKTLSIGNDRCDHADCVNCSPLFRDRNVFDDLNELLTEPPDFIELTNNLAESFGEEWRKRMIQVKKYKKMVVVAFTLE